MADIIRTLRGKWKYGSLLYRIIFINIAVFILLHAFSLVSGLINSTLAHAVKNRTAVVSVAVTYAALEHNYVYVYPIRLIPHSIQYGMAVLVRRDIFDYRYAQKTYSPVFLRRHFRGSTFYACLCRASGV